MKGTAIRMANGGPHCVSQNMISDATIPSEVYLASMNINSLVIHEIINLQLILGDTEQDKGQSCGGSHTLRQERRIV
jgi:hypothetical protein